MSMKEKMTEGGIYAALDGIQARMRQLKSEGKWTEQEWNKAFDEIKALTGRVPTWLFDDALEDAWVERRMKW